MLTTSPRKTTFVEKPEKEPQIGMETSSEGGQGPEGAVAPWKKKKKKKKKKKM